MRLQTISALLAFVLGLYQSESINRWWKVLNEGVAGMSSACQDLGMLSTSLLLDDRYSTLVEARERTAAYSELAMALLLRRVAGMKGASPL